ncbi:hypothetical protein R3W88_033604 [Solanum pinnatisectum]|uniref:Leucine-rich repeat-containing N-terminal plant-type domain-containing protein n=1 Tax=Solanum pinnatisectum TaxID=50273 RepID=A0AAV9K3U3_9SOLN|nr:hypothetical protein R3W88_033604 [Solanum pinnatisectum]
MSLFFFYSFLYFVLLVSLCFSSSFEHHLCSPTEASALLQYKQHFEIISYASYNCDRASFPKTKSWNESRDCCTWDGVTCDMLTGHIISLDLSCSQLFGNFHPNSSLFQLHHLHTLNFDNNYFNYSSIPHNIGRLTNLRHLNLSDRTFETMLHNYFTNLELLSLFNVNISSPIPVNISSSLRYLDLGYTNLRGVLTESFFLPPNSFETLKLSGNHLLKGVFPKIHRRHTVNGVGYFIHRHLCSLNHLNLYGCQFSGSIPDSIGNLTQITELDLSLNHFTGHIPSTISILKHLTIFGLTSNSFSGEIPDVFSNLQKLRYIDFFNNSFNGPFPASILSLTHLEYLGLSSNSLSGPLLSKASMLQKLSELDLSDNSLNGTIPSWVFNLPLVDSLWLHNNQFSGLADEIKTNPTLQLLYLNNNQLSGSFPQSLVNLTNLSTLDHSSNNITIDEGINITFPSLEFLLLSSCELKDFPHFLRNVKTIQYLDISNNKICGQIPNWFSGMRWDSLQFLNLSHNSLTGHLPQFRYDNLQYLYLKFNSLQGPLALSICNMSSLILLDLSHNYFSDSVPHCLGSMASLTVLDLRRNNFTRSLPPFCAQSTSLSTIVVNGNRFEGPVPVSLLNCNGLEVLDVGNNAINDTFPAWLGILQELQVLILKSNKFHGPISTGSLAAKVFGNFKAMIKLDDEDTREINLVIKGHDIELERISTIMTTIDLSSNHFEGVIPRTLMDLSSLWLLILSHNNLRGDIPMKLGKLNMLEALDLSWNRLTGKIPQELTRMNFLAFLNLSQNHLVGPIPQGQQFDTFENDSYGGNLDLCGLPLPKQCGTSDSSHAPQQLESEEDEGESYFFSYSFGLVVGTVMWSLMFKYRKPKWFVDYFDGLMPHRPKKRAQRRRT